MRLMDIVMICFDTRLLPDDVDSNDDTHDMGVAMGEHVMRVYPMTMMVTHTTRCSSSVL
jgi:hypothetical protein